MRDNYHFNRETGEVRKCRAKKKCPFGGETGTENHYNTADEARKAYELENDGSVTGVVKQDDIYEGNAHIKKFVDSRLKMFSPLFAEGTPESVKRELLTPTKEDYQAGKNYVINKIADGKGYTWEELMGKRIRINEQNDVEFMKRVEEKMSVTGTGYHREWTAHSAVDRAARMLPLRAQQKGVQMSPRVNEIYDRSWSKEETERSISKAEKVKEGLQDRSISPRPYVDKWTKGKRTAAIEEMDKRITRLKEELRTNGRSSEHMGRMFYNLGNPSF